MLRKDTALGRGTAERNGGEEPLQLSEQPPSRRGATDVSPQLPEDFSATSFCSVYPEERQHKDSWLLLVLPLIHSYPLP